WPKLPCPKLLLSRRVLPPLMRAWHWAWPFPVFAADVVNIRFGDWRRMIWRNESCFKEPWTFEFCCRHGSDVSALDRILEGTAQIQGNPTCWDESFQNNECCSLNHNLNLVPHYNHMIWQIRMPDGRMVNVVQGQALEHWERKKIIDPGRFPFVGLSGNGEGLVWSAGSAAVAFALAEFPDGRRPLRFLEVASSVGAPSLVALAKGFHVWSSE
ncbi:unnamed protein product, partial [Effrenium voratum]